MLLRYIKGVIKIYWRRTHEAGKSSGNLRCVIYSGNLSRQHKQQQGLALLQYWKTNEKMWDLWPLTGNGNGGKGIKSRLLSGQKIQFFRDFFRYFGVFWGIFWGDFHSVSKTFLICLPSVCKYLVVREPLQAGHLIIKGLQSFLRGLGFEDFFTKLKIFS